MPSHIDPRDLPNYNDDRLNDTWCVILDDQGHEDWANAFFRHVEIDPAKLFAENTDEQLADDLIRVVSAPGLVREDAIKAFARLRAIKEIPFSAIKAVEPRRKD